MDDGLKGFGEFGRKRRLTVAAHGDMAQLQEFVGKVAVPRTLAESFGSTSSTLLARARANDPLAWQRLVQLYSPLVYYWCRGARLQAADAADILQDVFHAVARSLDRFRHETERGSFRGWLFTVVRNKMRDFLTASKRPGRGSGDSDMQQRLQQLPARDEDRSAWWDEEYERRVFAWAAEQVRERFSESTWQAFWRVVVEDRSPAVVAEETGLSVNAVYLAKSRVLRRLREMLGEAE